jgi:putative Holliday junction resolvase
VTSSPGRILALDLGTRRIGVALSDPTRTFASPLLTLPHRTLSRDIEQVASLCRTHAASAVIVGWPRNMSGTTGPAARRAEEFAQALRRAVPVSVDLWDERLSTAAADRALREGNVRHKKRRAVRDQIAATVILQTYLDARGRSLATPGPGHKDS